MNFVKIAFLPAMFTAMMSLPVSPALTAGNFHFIHNSCKTGLQFTDSACDCLVAKVKSELNEKELTMFMAGIKEDPALMQEIQNTITREEMENVMNFMTVTPQQCQNQ